MILELLKIFLSSLIGTLGFALLLHAPKRAWIPAGVIGGAGYALYWVLLQLGIGDPAAIFAGSLLSSLLAQVCARRMKMIATVFVTLSIVPMVPGLGLYRCMELLGQGLNSQGTRVGVDAMISIVMMALGLAVGGFIYRVVATCAPRRAE